MVAENIVCAIIVPWCIITGKNVGELKGKQREMKTSKHDMDIWGDTLIVAH